MDSTVAAALIGGGAALLGSTGAGIVTSRVTRKTLDHNAEELATRLEEDRDAAREERRQARLQDTYVPLLRYVFWLSDVNSLSRSIVVRQYTEVTNLRLDREGPPTEAQADRERDAFLKAGATPEERKRLEAGPTYEDNADIWSRVKSFSSKPVLDAFETTMKRDQQFARKKGAVELELLGISASSPGVAADPSPATEIERAAEAARAKLAATSRLLTVTSEMVGAGEEFEASADTLTDLVRAELG